MPEDRPNYPTGARVITRCALKIDEIAPSPSGEQIAFESGPISHRLENPSDSELFLVSIHGGDARQMTHNQGLENHLTWTPLGKSINFLVSAGAGSIEGPYQDVQGRIYSFDLESAKTTRLGGDFQGSWEGLAMTGLYSRPGLAV